jgi:phosphate/sulfate permease
MGSAAALAFSHGANDAQKAIGVVAALLLADGRIKSLAGRYMLAPGTYDFTATPGAGTLQTITFKVVG